jgi:hypothetical protein
MIPNRRRAFRDALDLVERMMAIDHKHPFFG